MKWAALGVLIMGVLSAPVGGSSAAGRTFSGLMQAGGINTGDGWSVVTMGAIVPGPAGYEGDATARLSAPLGGGAGGIVRRDYSAPALNLIDKETEIKLAWAFGPVDNAGAYQLEIALTDGVVEKVIAIGLGYATTWQDTVWTRVADPNLDWKAVTRVELRYAVSGANPFEAPPDLYLDNIRVRFTRGGQVVSMGGSTP